MIPKPSKAAALTNVATKVTTGRASLQEAFVRSNTTAKGISQVLDRIDPKLVVYNTIRMAQYARRDASADQVCYIDDLFSERYQRMLAAIKSDPNVDIQPLGNFAEHIPAGLQPLANSRYTQIALLRAESALVRRSEDRVVATFRRSFMVNDREADLLISRSGVEPDRIRVIPPLIPAPAPAIRQFEGRATFVFLGLLSLPHNDDGIRSFIANVWPLVLTRRRDATLRIIGRSPRPELLTLVSKFASSVALEGYVPDLNQALNGAAALINPLRFGSGIKLKVIEALGRGLPVVSTSLGAENFDTGPEAGILVSDEPAQLADYMCSLLAPAQNTQFSNAARSHFAAKYSREAVFKAYDSAFALG